MSHLLPELETNFGRYHLSSLLYAILQSSKASSRDLDGEKVSSSYPGTLHLLIAGPHKINLCVITFIKFPVASTTTSIKLYQMKPFQLFIHSPTKRSL